MKRDCGQGELKPVKWEVVSTGGFSDTESVNIFSSREQAEQLFAITEKGLTNASSVRLYAKDKQGYANCVLITIKTAKGEVNRTDRRSEL